MTIRVHLPDDSFADFPDGMPQPDIEAVLQRHFGSPQQSPRPHNAHPWSDVVANPEFQKLSPAQQDAARQQYFDTVVAPNVPTDKRAVAKQQFDDYHRSIYREPASSDQILEALRKADAAGETDDALQLAEMYKEAHAREAASSGGKSSGKNLGDLISGTPHQRTWGEFLSGADAAFRNNVAGGASFGLTNRMLTPEEKAADAEHPIASTAGDLIGGLMSGSTELKALSAIPGAARFIATKAGQPVANAARVLGIGAAAGAERAAGEGTDIGEGALAGAAGGAAGAAGAKVVGAVVRRAQVGAAIAAAAKRINEDPARLQAAMDNFSNVTGHPPTLVEIINAGSAEELGRVAEARIAAGDVFRDAERRVAAQRPGTMQAQIGQGGRDTVSRIDAAQAQAADDLMGQIGNSTAVIPESIPVAARQAIARNAQQLASNGNPVPQQLLEKGEIDLRTLDLARRDLAKQARAKPGEGFDFSRNYVSMLGARANPRYRSMLDQFAAAERQIAGVEAGQAGTNPNNLRGVESADAGTPEFAAGRAAGTRNRLAAAVDSERGAVNTANLLRQAPADLVDALGPREAGRLQGMGAAETTSAERFKQVVPAQRAASDELARGLTDAVERVVAAGGRTLTGYKAHVITRLITSVRISNSTARRLADLATDPAQLPGVIAQLRRARLTDDRIRQILVPVAAVAGQRAGAAVQ